MLRALRSASCDQADTLSRSKCLEKGQTQEDKLGTEIWKQWAAGEEILTTTFSPSVHPNPPKLKVTET